MRSEDYFQEEVRNDFLVNKKRKQIWAIQMDLLQQVLYICEKYNIECFAVAGTLLGAIRHQGYIPWDDDMDIAFRRTDFNKFCEVAQDELQYPYYFQYALSEKNFYEPAARIRNSETTGLITRQKKYISSNHGIYLDILVFDKIPDNVIKKKMHYLQIDFYTKLIGTFFCENYDSISKKNVARVINKIFARKRDLRSVYNRLVEICGKYEHVDTKKVSYVMDKTFREEYIWDSKDIASVEYVSYEYMKMPVPINYEKCLKKQYGDYMKLPPVEKRGLHHEFSITFEPEIPYRIYLKQEGKKNE